MPYRISRDIRTAWLMPCVTRSTLVAMVIVTGCSSHDDFVQLGPGIAISARSIDEYAEEHGLSRDEAKAQLAAQITSSEPPDE